MAYRRYFGGLLFGMTIVCLLFFVLFAFHADTAVRQDVKAYLDGMDVGLPFGALENSHLGDVRTVLLLARMVTALLVVIALWLLSRDLVNVWVGGGFLVIAPLLLSLVSWDRLFIVFHTIFFPMGNWRFSADSLLLVTYPESFFSTFAVVWGCSCVFVGAMLFLFHRKLLFVRRTVLE